MKKLGYIFALLMLVIWFVCYILFNIGGAIHFVFLAGVLFLIAQLIRDFRE